MRPIPKALKDKMASKRFYQRCCLCGVSPVEWHHNLIFGGKQVNEEWCILPVCKPCHKVADRKDIKERLNWIMLNRGSNFELQSVSKAINYENERTRLNDKFGGAWKYPKQEEPKDFFSN